MMTSDEAKRNRWIIHQTENFDVCDHGGTISIFRRFDDALVYIVGAIEDQIDTQLSIISKIRNLARQDSDDDRR